MWLYTWVLTNWNFHRAPGSCCPINRILAWFYSFFLFLVHLNKSKLGKAAKSIGFKLERTPTCHQFNCCNIFKNQKACDCSRDLFNPGGKWVTWSGKEEMYSSCGSIKHQNIHIIGAGAWKNVSDCCSRPQIVWQAFASPKKKKKKLSRLQTNVQRPKLCAKSRLVLVVCNWHSRTIPTFYTYCMVD